MSPSVTAPSARIAFWQRSRLPQPFTSKVLFLVASVCLNDFIFHLGQTFEYYPVVEQYKTRCGRISAWFISFPSPVYWHTTAMQTAILLQGACFFLGGCICEQVRPCYLCLVAVHSHMGHIMIFQFLPLIMIHVNICSSGDICKLEDLGERGRRATFTQTVIIEDSKGPRFFL
jgi:hypothetical protein